MAQPIREDALFDIVWSIVTRRAAERTAAAVDLLNDILHSYGYVHRREHELFAGDRSLNEDRQILARVSRATGLGLALYLGNRRIASVSVLDAGEALEPGGYADALVVEHVLRKRETFRGEIDRAGRTQIIACRPLLSTDKPDEYGPIGMIEAYMDRATMREIAAAAVREGIGTEALTADEQNADRMEGVMHFIDDVARRLQLLALNGNIIAAQAGDHGRAFRVVCRELSSLADQAKDAVAEVRRLSELLSGDRDLDLSLPSGGEAALDDELEAETGP